MRSLNLSFLLLIAAAFSSKSFGNSLSLFDGKVKCEVSHRLLPLPERELNTLQMRPLAAYSTIARDARITVTLGVHPQPMRIGDLPEVKQVMRSGFTKLFPDARWAASEIVTINGRPWIHFDLTSSTPRIVRSALCITSFQGDQLQFLFQAEAGSTQEVWSSLEQCSISLRVEE